MKPTMGPSRRHLLGAITGLAVSGLALGTAPACAQDKPFAGSRISVLMVGHPTSDAVKKALPEFTELTGIEVDLEVVPEADATPKMLLELSAGTGRYDVIENNTIMVPGFVEAGYLAPLDDLAAQHGKFFDRADLVEAYLKPNMVDGKTFGLPIFGESSFLMYRKDLFEEYGIAVPTTFDGIAFCGKLMQAIIFVVGKGWAKFIVHCHQRIVGQSRFIQRIDVAIAKTALTWIFLGAETIRGHGFFPLLLLGL